MTIDTINPVSHANATERRSAFRAVAAWRRLLALCVAYFEKRRTRRALRELSCEQLHDIGLTRREAMTEANRSFFWD